jgi:hypothetical protein
MQSIEQEFEVTQYARSSGRNKAYNFWSLPDIRDDIGLPGMSQLPSKNTASLGLLHKLKNMGFDGRVIRGVEVAIPTSNASTEVHHQNLIRLLEIPNDLPILDGENHEDEADDAEESYESYEAKLASLQRELEELTAKMSAKKPAKKSAKKARLL